jgi:hypothetical protein
METRTRLTADDLVQIIAGVFAYNDIEVTSVDFDIRNDTIAAEVLCEAPALRVRTSPDSAEAQALARMTDDILAKMRSS